MIRQCGYCREAGHTKPKCPVMQYKLDFIRKYVPRERKNVVDLILKNGYGVGAIVEVFSYRAGGMVTGMITTHQNLWQGYYGSSMVEYRNVKYQKRVRVTVKNFTGLHYCVPEMPLSNGEIFIGNIGSVYLEAMNLVDTSENITASLVYNSLEHKFDGTVPRRGYVSDYHAKLLSPSYETDVTDETYTKDIPGHERLVDTRTITGIITW